MDWEASWSKYVHINLSYVWKLAKAFKNKRYKDKVCERFLKIMKPWVKQDSLRCVW